MSDYLWLILGHLLADYPLQPESMSSRKGHDYFVLLVHSAIWALVAGAILTWLGHYQPWKVVFLLVTHFGMDWWKCTRAPQETVMTTSLYLDQAFHLVTLWLVLR